MAVMAAKAEQTMTLVSQPTGSNSVFTIGYGARAIDALIAALKAQQIAYLLDVRTAPYSRYRPEYSQDALRAALEAQGIRYVYMGDQLGGRPADPDCYVGDKVDYACVRTKPYFQAGIARVQNAFAQGRRVVLMCSEGRPEECHRSKLIGEALVEVGVPVQHLDEEDRMQSHAEVIARLADGQLSLFGQEEFTSRRRYRREETEAEEMEEESDA